MNDSDLQKGLDTCTFCPKLCYHACPVARESGREAETPWGLATLANLAHKKIIPFTEELAKNMYRCLDCLGCWSACELDNNVPALLHPFRARAFEEDKAPIPLYSFSHKFREWSNPYGRDLATIAGEFLKGIEVDGVRDTVYFAGCSTLASLPESVRAWVRFHKKLGIPCPQIFKDPVQCCGYPMYAAGDLSQFKDIAQIQYHALKGASVIISPMPECLHTFGKLYPQMGIRLKARMIHVSTYLVEILRQSNFKVLERREPVLYLDSCMLGRTLDVYDDPRDLLTQRVGVELREFGLHHDRSVCCGAAMPFSVLDGRAATAIAGGPIQEAVERGIGVIVTASPLCAAHMRKVRNGSPGVAVYDLMEYLESMIG